MPKHDAAPRVGLQPGNGHHSSVTIESGISQERAFGLPSPDWIIVLMWLNTSSSVGKLLGQVLQQGQHEKTTQPNHGNGIADDRDIDPSNL